MSFLFLNSKPNYLIENWQTEQFRYARQLITQDTFVCVIMYSTSVNLIKEQNPATTFIKLKSPLFKALRLFFTVHGSAVHKYALPINSMKTIYNRLMECCDLVWRILICLYISSAAKQGKRMYTLYMHGTDDS